VHVRDLGVPHRGQVHPRGRADQPGTPGTAAIDWAKLSDRMRFILDLFRSRQCDSSLQEEPFTSKERSAVLGQRV
jgi:hypothetical protein